MKKKRCDVQTCKAKRVGFAFPLGVPYLERMLTGVLDYTRVQGDWVITRMHEQFGNPLEQLAAWDGDGAIVAIWSGPNITTALELKIPVVNVVGHQDEATIPTLRMDHEEAGRMAARHLIQQHFSRFGFYGSKGAFFSQARAAGFTETIRQAGFPCSLLETWRGNTNKTRQQLEHWIKTLTPPVAVMACTDLRAWALADTCQRIGLKVPDDVAIIGVDNDPTACNFCTPPLTSISRNDHELGWRAAELLDKLMSGQPAPAAPILIQPDGVVQRQSTDTLGIDDPVVASCVQYAREHLDEPFGAERLDEHAGLSRRQLEYRFHKCFGTTPYAIISKLRVERAMIKLKASNALSLSDIAAACGFSDLRHFRHSFERITGQSPAQFREENAVAAPPG